MRRYFYLVYLAAFGVCGALGVHGWQRMLSPEESPVARPAVRRVVAVPERPRNKDGATLAARNMFCSTCTGEPPPPPGGGGERAVLPLDLLATHVAQRDERSFAAIRNRKSLRVGAYRVGDEIPGSGVVERIRGGYVVVLNAATQRSERFDLSSKPTAKTRPAAIVDEGEHELQRSVIEAMMTHPERIKGARARLAKGGVKLYAVRRNSPFAKAGLRNGDVLTAANGMDLSSPDAILEALGPLSRADRVELTVLRRGKEVRLRFVIR